MSLFSKHAVNHLASRGAHHVGIDPKRGWSLFWTRGVPAGYKLLSVAIGVTVTGVLLALELPLEGILATLAPIVGLVADAAIDGLEVVALPTLLACCMLSLLVRRPIPVPVSQSRRVD